MARVLIGTSGFQFDDWRGTVYPTDLPRQEMFNYYQKLGFEALELNFTYYQLPTARTIQGLVSRSSSSFIFAVRSHQDMTHRLWTDQERKIWKENRGVFIKFREGLDPLIAAGQLGAILLQFPYFFWPKRESFEYLERCREYLPDLPVCVEFRNKAWARESTFRFLKEHHLGFAVVDEPPLPPLMPLVPRVTSALGYLRLHGRNTAWFKADKAERYHYNYTLTELESFVPVIRKMAREAPICFIFFNNCHRGYAAKNALLFKEMLAKGE
jgi:uncharacterized protein YecE (DUF72 family)